MLRSERIPRVAALALALMIPASAVASPLSADPAELLATGSDDIFDNGFEQFTLTINDWLNWCNVSTNGGAPTATPSPQTFTQGTVVGLQADPLVGFIWGFWTGTDNVDPVTHEDTKQSTTVTMSADRSVLVCCPFSNGTGCPTP